MTSPMIWLYFFQLLQIVSCVPIISFPFNAQLPPVARIGRLYSYAFSSYTFQSDTNITYQLQNGPKWLSLDGKNRRLFGIPNPNDVPPIQGSPVGQTFQIVATDATGSMTMDGTIVVAGGDGPEIKIPVSEQIKRFGSYSAPSSILSYPSTDFSFTFDTNTFAHPASGINYYASSGNSSPLPAWVKFDAGTLSFSGRTPAIEALYQPPQKFDMRLVASDVAGFSSTSIDFSIVVGSHKLTAESPVITLNASRGTSFKYGGLANAVRLDGKPASSKDLTTAVAALPGWLKFDPDTWAIEGMPKKDDRSTNFTVKFTDAFSDTLEVLVKANVATGLFKETLDQVQATPGEHFSLDLASYLKDPKDIELKVVTKPGQNWLKIDGVKVEGDVPSSATDDLEIRIEATSRSSNVMESEMFQMTFRPADGSTKTAPSATSTGSPNGPEETGDGSDNKDESESKGGGLGTSGVLLATILPIIAVSFFVMLLVYLLRRRRIRKSKISRKDFRDKISKPIVGSLRMTGSGQIDHVFGNVSPSNHNQASQAEKGAIPHHGSRGTSRSSQTLGSLTSSRAMGSQNGGYEPLHDVSSEDDRRSWFTVERVPTGMRSQGSLRSKHSDTTGLISTHQLLPTPPFLSYAGEGAFNHGLEFTIPSLTDLPNLQLDPEVVSNHPQQPRSAALYSTITSSSAALPSSRLNSPEVESGFVASVPAPAPVQTPAPAPAPTAPAPAPPVPARSRARTLSSGGSVRRTYRKSRTSSDRDWTTIGDSDGEKIPDLPPPHSLARLPSHQWLSRHATDDMSASRPASSKRAKSFATETSFGSTENWRVIGRYDRNAPELPPPAHILAHRRSSPSLVTPASAMKPAETIPAIPPPPPVPESSPANSRPSTSRSRYSKLNEDEEKGKEAPTSASASAWRREDSEKASRGSFAAFI